IAMDTGPAATVRSDSSGHAMRGVELRIGDDPRSPVPPGTIGRVWVAGPALAAGYGFPPEVEPLPAVDGWWGSPDVGELEPDGRLFLAGRLDDCIRTGAGQVVSTALVSAVLEAHPAVMEAVVVPIGDAGDPVLAALLESAEPLDLGAVRAHLAS